MIQASEIQHADKIVATQVDLTKIVPFKKRPLKVYLASPFFNEEEIERVEFVEKTLRAKGLEVFSPREQQNEHLEFGSKEWRKATFDNDVKEILKCDIIVAVHSLDSGTNWELGAGSVIQRPIILFDDNTKLPRNIMLTESCHAFLESREALEAYDFDVRIDELEKVYYEGEVI
ncbi:nucleoside 2-deoxyribosyltransferase [Bacillus thuringiensis serovar silo]|uniref:nucleoside 2-deoxyribosyltransferase n=1 Tax=Bacillus thuringiensis TaxID=1428 RepID=UPI000A37FB77|nr:nucleoside 2-deoxyribosyltransferase [Bacillus thuringiensis]MDA2128669.1 nucleoside 2-deoxyribosyltransferase [Bacillus cereus]MED3275386.1 nucleoside 2-deoxyribosyltransferase [Bacillus thuringiensis]OTW55323.1 nucleoside 2-deoxyribosyltransferase [Bacillus thuringiensis serovar silo]OTW74245.1 nucleoside 2-deoxyribosyltransferase [Bacillus thuringiensis serovar toguchini]